jgi:PhnB protein
MKINRKGIAPLLQVFDLPNSLHFYRDTILYFGCTDIESTYTFLGNCESAHNFYKSVFGVEFIFTGYYRYLPQAEGQTFPHNRDEQIMHISLSIRKELILMRYDGQITATEKNFSLSNITERNIEADRLFSELSVLAIIELIIGHLSLNSFHKATILLYFAS